MESPILLTEISTQIGGSVFFACLLLSVFFFVAIESIWLIKKLRGSSAVRVSQEHSDLIWSIIPAIVLLSLTYA